ncbi:MAG: aspartate aminotransferase family protein [Dehalococcoidia bacterium]
MASTNSNLFRRSATQPLPEVVRAEGVWIESADGRRYLDGSAGALVASIGHGVRAVVEAQARQAGAVAYVHGTHFSVPAQENLAARLAAMAPAGLDRVYPVSGGSEANESAIKFARQVHLERGEPERHLTIGRQTSYHGNTLGALAVSGHAARRQPYRPLLRDQPHIPASYCYRCPFGLEPASCGARCAEELEVEVKRTGAQYISAFIAEPVVGAAGGALVPPPEYFAIIREICDRYGVLFIADEVMTGIGRTGKNFAVDHWNVVPDVITTGKGVGGGYAPLGAMIVQERHFQTIAQGTGSFVHGFTYGGHPPSVAAGAAVLAYVQEHDLVARSATMGERLAERLDPLRDRPIVGDLRGLGLMRGIELVRDRRTKEPFDRSLRVAERIGEAAFERGLIIYPGSGNADGINGDQILIGPPLVISEAEVDLLAERLIEAVDAVMRDLT